MDPLMHIQENMNLLTKQEQRVAQYVIDHPEDVVNMNTQEIGNHTNTSSASVIRFIKKMNYSGLSDFKVTISRNLPDAQLKVYKKIEKDETIDSIKSKLLARAHYSMEATSQILKDEDIENAIQLIEQAKCIILFGIGASNIVAQDLYQKLLRVGLNVICSKDTHLIAATIAAQKEKVLFIGISSSGNTQEVNKLLKVAEKNGANRLGITSNRDSETALISEHVILHDASTEESLRLAATSSLMSQLYCIDILFYSYLINNFDLNREVIEDTRNAVRMFEDLG